MKDHSAKAWGSRRWVPAVLLLGLVLRVVYLVQYSHSPFWDQLTVDNWYHHHWAQSLADGNIVGDTTYFRAPLYVYCLGLLYAIFGSSFWVGRLFGLTIGIMSIGMTFLIARRLVGRSAAVLAALFHAALPIAIYFESELLLDPLFTLLMQIAIWCFLRWLDTDRSRDLFLAGLLFGLAAICRPTVLAVGLVAVGWIAFKRPPDRRDRTTFWRVSRMTLFGAGLVICIGPVFVRNLMVAGDPVLIASQGGINFYIGNNEDADGLSAVLPEPLGHNWQIRQITYLAEKELGRNLKPGEVSAYWQSQARNWIESHPADFATLLLRKLVYLIANREIPNERSLETHFASFSLLGRNPLIFGLIFPSALLGLVVLWRRNAGARFLGVAIGVFMPAVALFFVSSRFRLPLMPLYCVLAAGGLSWLWSTARIQPLRVTGAIAGLAVLGWISFYPPVSYPEGWSTQGLTSRGLYLYSKGEYRDALTYFRRVADVQPDSPEAYLNLGAVYLRLGVPDSALTCFQREVALHPRRHKGYQNLASVYLLKGETGKAEESARTALDLAPYDELSNMILLRIVGTGTDRSSSELRNEVDLAARNTDNSLAVLNEGAGLLVNRGDIDGALEFLYRAETAQPPPIETDDDAFGAAFDHRRTDYERLRAVTYYLLGYCYARLDRTGDAVDYTRRAINADSNMVEAYVNLRSGLLAEGRLLEADSILNEVRRRFPDDKLIQSLTPRSR